MGLVSSFRWLCECVCYVNSAFVLMLLSRQWLHGLPGEVTAVLVHAVSDYDELLVAFLCGYGGGVNGWWKENMFACNRAGCLSDSLFFLRNAGMY